MWQSILLVCAAVAAGEEKTPDSTAMLQKNIGVKLQAGTVNAPLGNLKAADVDLTVLQESKDPNCTLRAEARMGAAWSIGIFITEHEMRVDKIRGDYVAVFFHDAVGEGQEIITVGDEEFIEAENNEDKAETSVGLVNVGAELNHNGTEWLKHRSMSVNTADLFRKQIKTMLNDPAANLVFLSSLALIQAGFHAKIYPCTRPFHLYALQLAKFSPMVEKDTAASLISSISLSEAGRTNTSFLPWNPLEPRLPYQDCDSDYMGQCGLPGQCWELASGCDGCGCMRGCEYHDHYCTCVSMFHHVCWRMSFGGWESCGPCVGPERRMDDNTRRRRFWD